MSDRRECTRCVMDTSAPDIVFYSQGQCSYCEEFLDRWRHRLPEGEKLREKRDKLIEEIKLRGKDKEYDCIVGVSGGVDSSYALLLAIRAGLRPLAVHLDNGWNSELATNNIASLVTALNVDLHTHVINWEENRKLQLSFLKSNVIDIELLMDNAMLALNYRQAAEHRINFILAGTNTSTEGFRMPPGWNHNKFDVRNIRAIAGRYSDVEIKTHPLISSLDVFRYEQINGIRWISFLDHFVYNKEVALDELMRECDYKPYPYKHYESVFTRFYQGYILPRKFGVDKRRLHLSNLVVTDQMKRKDALELLNEDPYPDQRQKEKDFDFVVKKLGVTEEWFSRYISEPPVLHSAYQEEWSGFQLIVRIARRIRSILRFW